MYHFFVAPSQISEKEILITGSDVNHMKNVLRMKPGEEIEIGDGQGREYHCAIEALEEPQILAKIMWVLEADSELPSRIYLFQGLPKSDKMEWITQKAVELGVFEIIPVASKRAIVKLDAKKEQNKLKRWNSISESAAKQSGRAVIPKVKPVMSFSEALAYASGLDACLIPYELAENMDVTRDVFQAVKRGQSIGIFIGPEGGFEESEVQAAMEMGAKAVTLGKRILRTETAGLAVLSMLVFLLEE